MTQALTQVAEARALLADELAAMGPSYRNAADSIRTGGYGNMWTAAAERALGKLLRTIPNDDPE